MARTLAYTVYIKGPDGKTVPVLAGSEEPAWAKGKIGDHAFDAGDDSDEMGPPPRTGKGSGLAAWATYAAAHGIELDDDATKDDIIDALAAADVPVDEPES